LLVQLDLVKTRQQCGANQAIPMIVASVIREKGAAGLFSGLVRVISFENSIAEECGIGILAFHDKDFADLVLSSIHFVRS